MPFGRFCVLILIFNIKGNLCECQDNCNSIVNSECISDECTCPQGYVINSKSNECLPYATEYHGSCAEDQQCKWLGDNSKCIYGQVCGCEENFVWYQGKCQKYAGLGGDCTNNAICFDGYNFQSLVCASEGKCACNSGADYYQRGDADCRKIGKNEGDLCALDVDCQFENGICVLGKCKKSTSFAMEEGVLEEEDDDEFRRSFIKRDVGECEEDKDCTASNSYCFGDTGTCVCKQGYFFNEEGTNCIAEIGVSFGCTEDADCPLKPGKCDQDSGTCFCRDYYFVEDGNRKCVKTMSQNNWDCLSKEWCFALGKYSYCSSLGNCSCSHNSSFDGDNFLCSKPEGEGDDQFCDNDYKCRSTLLNGFCIDERCDCQSGYRLEDNKCLPNIGSPCDNTTMLCSIENAICTSDKICQCAESFVNDPQLNTVCYPLRALGENCEKSFQCSTQNEFAICKNKKCSCGDNSVEYEHFCYEKRGANSYCTSKRQCQISLGDTFVCRNNLCQCPTGHRIKNDKCSSGERTSFSLIVVCVLVIIETLFG